MLFDDEPAAWRKRAEEVRVRAEEMKDPECRRAMFEIAKTYDWMAERARERLLDKSGLPPDHNGRRQ
jgi:hypothetical protein